MSAIEILCEHQKWSSTSVTPLSGGSINDVYKLVTNEGSVVVKSNSSSRFPKMFQEEKKGLLELSKSSFVVPKVLDVLEIESFQFLILEFIQQGPEKEDFWPLFAQKLAEMHQISQPNFGWDSDNYMGELPQSNKMHDTWSSFYWEERIWPQLKLAVENNYYSPDIYDSVRMKLIPWLKSQEPVQPSLVHGDLWSGNFMVAENGQPVLIDPAVHYANREIDIAMTQLFGGFGSEFYDSYQDIFPMPQGWEQRIKIYQLYPLLIHLNLFGRSYKGSVNNIIAQL